jgi:hypothetical protein
VMSDISDGPVISQIEGASGSIEHPALPNR